MRYACVKIQNWCFTRRWYFTITPFLTQIYKFIELNISLMQKSKKCLLFSHKKRLKFVIFITCRSLKYLHYWLPIIIYNMLYACVKIENWCFNLYWYFTIITFFTQIYLLSFTELNNSLMQKIKKYLLFSHTKRLKFVIFITCRSLKYLHYWLPVIIYIICMCKNRKLVF